MGLLFALLSALFYGGWVFVGKLATIQQSGAIAGFWNGLSLFVFFAVFVGTQNEYRILIRSPQGVAWGLIAGIVSAIASLFYYKALKLLPAGTVAAYSALYPAITLVLSALFLREPITPQRVVGFALAIVGIAILSR